jgi:hypothetical protein
MYEGSQITFNRAKISDPFFIGELSVVNRTKNAYLGPEQILSLLSFPNCHTQVRAINSSFHAGVLGGRGFASVTIH